MDALFFLGGLAIGVVVGFIAGSFTHPDDMPEAPAGRDNEVRH